MFLSVMPAQVKTFQYKAWLLLISQQIAPAKFKDFHVFLSLQIHSLLLKKLWVDTISAYPIAFNSNFSFHR